MLTKIISQGRKEGNPQFTVQLSHDPSEQPFFHDKPIEGVLDLWRDHSGIIHATVTVREYVPPKADAATA